ncbi:MAG TPA: TlpA disulfide reductase family protein [Thermodesulfobacteriota bacterium]|nr:TlpA disulfide reductase family protein [Thermodesulfobacteriota bacterium]
MNRYFQITMLLCAFFIFACEQKVITSEETPQNTETQEKEELKTAYNFKLENLDGSGTVELSDFKDKPVIVNFWASWCAPCREEMPFLQKTWEEHKDKGLVFIGIDVIDDTASAKEFLDSFNINYLNLNDSKGKTSSKYSVIALPATFFINRKGKIVKQNYGPFLGESGEKLFNKYLEEILN